MAKHKKILYFIAVLVLLLVLVISAVFLLSHLLKKLELAQYPQKYAQYVQLYSEEYGVPSLLVYAFIKTESGFKPAAKSDVNAIGLMQITEETFDWIKMKNFTEDNTQFEDLLDAQTNIKYGTYLLAQCLDRYGDISTAAAAYHSGWGTVDKLLEDASYTENGKNLSSFPYNQMQHYVYKINKNYERYKKIYQTEAE